jgi:hypothetical protein
MAPLRAQAAFRTISVAVTHDRTATILAARVGLTCQHPNPGWLADGPEITIRAVGGHRL